MIIDSHYYPANWGIRPVLFTLFGVDIPAYSFFVALGIIAAIVYYVISARKSKTMNEHAFYIVFSALVFGTLGAKLPIWIANYKQILENPTNLSLILSGRTIVGGLIGGTLGVYFVKKRLNIKLRMGNHIAPAIALGMAIGRLGCFFRGCCYGKHTELFWGVNFGDGILRHPTQIYEVIFNFAVFVFLVSIKEKVKTPGILFKIFLNCYFAYRFLSEFIRIEPVIWMGLTAFQLASLFALVFINRNLILRQFKREEVAV